MLVEIWSTPFIVPVAGCAMVLGLGVAGIYSEIQSKRLRAEQRMAMIARGIPLEEIEKLLSKGGDIDRPVRDPLRSLAIARRTALVLISSGVGLVIFGLLLAVILQVREVYAAPAAGVIPIAIGIGFLVDYKLQARELARFGLEVDEDMTPKP
jgi:hypothetical protein